MVLLTGITLAITLGLTYFSRITLEFTHSALIAPHRVLSSTLSLVIPLVAISLTGQFLSSAAVLRDSGYDTPAKLIMAVTSVASIGVTFFDDITTVTVAITITLYTGKDARDDPSRRYTAGIANGVFYLIGGTFASAIMILFAALPRPFMAILIRLALIGVIASNVMGTIENGEHREASTITFPTTASGLTLLGLDSALWGIVIDSAAALVLRSTQR